MRRLVASLFAVTLAASAATQGVAYGIPNSDPTSGNCNVIPFGTTANNATWANQRMQVVATASDLGSVPGLVTGLSFAPCATGVHYTDSIRITMALVPAGFTFSGGNNNFDQNLNAVGFAQVVVLDQREYTWQKNGNQWSSIGLDQSFVYDGQSDLLIDLVLEGNDADNGSSSMHRDTRERLYAATWAGTPPATGRVGNNGTKFRVELQCADITTYGLGCGGLEMSASGSSALGGTLTVAVSGAASGLPVVFGFGSYNGVPFPIDLSGFGAFGCRLRNSTDASAISPADAAGRASLALAIPGDPGLMGARLFFQCLHVNPAMPGGIAVSKGGRAVLGVGCP
ncbi:MAG: hypothetical protein O3C51_08435 [Planctomycetota bacterium]|nr:hypothetical protein [Planctomycetota bacterium]